MATKIIHISDIHYKTNRAESDDLVIIALVDDIKAQIALSPEDDFFLVFSGDIAQSGDDRDAYEQFAKVYGSAFDKIGIQHSHRICLPGNHDVSRSRISQSLVDHEGVVSQCLDEIMTNNYIEKCSPVFVEKFAAYRAFESKFCHFQTLSSSIEGTAHTLNDQIGMYCLNSAIFSSAGVEGHNEHPLEDKGRLNIGTRGLHSWLADSNTPCRILVSHHPLDWLPEWASGELRSVLNKNFALFLSGHAHDQLAYHLITPDKPCVCLHAPPLFTSKHDTLGYAIISICNIRHCVEQVCYRQWTSQHQRFLPGVCFSGTENGKIVVKSKAQEEAQTVNPSYDVVDRYLSSELDDALMSFSAQPRVWVDRIISDKPERDNGAAGATRYDVNSLITEPISTFIQAPPQFGLSSLARYMAQQAWRAGQNARWSCLDARQIKPSECSIRRALETELQKTGQSLADLRGIVLDSWRGNDRDAVRILKMLCSLYPDVPIIVMHTAEGQSPVGGMDENVLGRHFRVCHLWSLAREHVRTMVSGYNVIRHVGDEDAVTSRVVSDIDTLNLHRTPFNCLTVLKASEGDFDENPVNRTDILHRVLFLLFNTDSVPRYKARPDMKDCEHVLGYLAEQLLRANAFVFSRDSFMENLKGFCQEQVIAVNIEVLFDILHDAHILVPFGSDYTFKFTSWLYYFAAHRMHHDKGFADFILADMRYSRFPEIIEFYTGIDRQRQNAVEVLSNDIKLGVSEVQRKCGLPRELNPFALLQWQVSPETLERMESELRNGVAASNLPDVIKDRYADRSYDPSRPYIQSVRDILTGHTMLSLMLSVSAGARALRNSDYVSPKAREDLLDAILDAWRQISQVLFVLLPPLAETGHATFDGAGFVLTDDFGNDPAQRQRSVLVSIPDNVVAWYQDQLYSPKMALLLAQAMKRVSNDIAKLELIMMQIVKRPQGWKDQVEHYIYNIHKTSFYLSTVNSKLREEYAYAFIGARDLRDLEYLIKMVATKHIYGVKEPGPKAINKISDNVLPKRIVLVDQSAGQAPAS